MAVDLDVTQRDGVVWVKLPRMIDGAWLLEALGSLHELCDLCASSESAGIVFDVRGVELRLKWWHLLRFVFDFRAACSKGVGVAAVVEPSHRMPRREFHSLAGMAGLLLGVFGDEARAIAWLKEVSASGRGVRQPKRRRAKRPKRRQAKAKAANRAGAG